MMMADIFELSEAATELGSGCGTDVITVPASCGTSDGWVGVVCDEGGVAVAGVELEGVDLLLELGTGRGVGAGVGAGVGSGVDWELESGGGASAAHTA